MHRVLYHVLVNVLASINGHKIDVTHIRLHLFYGILRDIKINFGAFMIQYMTLYKKDAKKELAYGQILTWIFSRYRVSFEVIVEIRPSERDRFERDCFTWSITEIDDCMPRVNLSMPALQNFINQITFTMSLGVLSLWRKRMLPLTSHRSMIPRAILVIV